MRRADDGHAFSVPMQEPGVKAKHVIARSDYVIDRGILHHRNCVPNVGDLRWLSAISRRARLDNYFIVGPARVKTFYELRVD
jgi:hypothetical protein